MSGYEPPKPIERAARADSDDTEMCEAMAKHLEELDDQQREDRRIDRAKAAQAEHEHRKRQERDLFGFGLNRGARRAERSWSRKKGNWS